MEQNKNCEHGVVEKYCFNCKFKEKYGIKVEMFEGHHYVRLKAVESLLFQATEEAVRGSEKSFKKELEWLKRRLHDHSFDEKTVNLEYVDARIDDIISSNNL